MILPKNFSYNFQGISTLNTAKLYSEFGGGV